MLKKASSCIWQVSKESVKIRERRSDWSQIWEKIGEKFLKNSQMKNSQLLDHLVVVNGHKTECENGHITNLTVVIWLLIHDVRVSQQRPSSHPSGLSTHRVLLPQPLGSDSERLPYSSVKKWQVI